MRPEPIRTDAANSSQRLNYVPISVMDVFSDPASETGFETTIGCIRSVDNRSDGDARGDPWHVNGGRSARCDRTQMLLGRGNALHRSMERTETSQREVSARTITSAIAGIGISSVSGSAELVGGDDPGLLDFADRVPDLLRCTGHIHVRDTPRFERIDDCVRRGWR